MGVDVILLLIAVVILISFVKKLYKLATIAGILAAAWFFFGNTITVFIQSLM